VTLDASLDFTGRNVLVVGGSSGIGNGIAQAFRSRGARVHVWGTRSDAADYTGAGSELSGLGYTQVDVAEAEAIEAVTAPFDRLDILVLSQGTVVYRRGEFERAGWDQVLSVHLDSLMHCCRRFHAQLKASSGSIIIVSSISAFMANCGNPAYSASKAGAVALTRTLGQAWCPDRIRVNGIAPGFVDTKLTKATVEHPQRMDAALARIPVGRLGTPEDMAGVALFLASPLAAFVVGQTIVVDGGRTL
jgi:3-oxoacyl-[acyl-carrier protein] reductase